MPLRISNTEGFAKHIEHIVRMQHLSYMEAVLEFCQHRDIEPSDIVPFLSDKMKQAIAVEATRLHLLHKTAELPFDELS